MTQEELRKIYNLLCEQQNIDDEEGQNEEAEISLSRVLSNFSHYLSIRNKN